MMIKIGERKHFTGLTMPWHGQCLTQTLTRDLFAVDNFLVIILAITTYQDCAI